MRLGLIWEPCSNAHYRAIEPMKAMERRGHEVLWPPDNEGPPDLRRHTTCDVVHVFRRCDTASRRDIAQLARGTPITFDNDIDISLVPPESPRYKEVAGGRGQQRFLATTAVARLARVCTVTNDTLAARYRAAGVKRIEIIDNHLAPPVPRPRTEHAGVVVGWIAAPEHVADAQALNLATVLEELVERHSNVRVECIGIDLRLSQRYRHDAATLFDDLPQRIGGFDIGIAPLADIPYNYTRSNIKVKEYAASGVPWLASPVGPYRGLGEEQGGRLVAPDQWFTALERLVTRKRERRRLARNAEAWAKGETIEAVADRWERVFLEAAGTTAADEAEGGRLAADLT